MSSPGRELIMHTFASILNCEQIYAALQSRLLMQSCMVGLKTQACAL